MNYEAIETKYRCQEAMKELTKNSSKADLFESIEDEEHPQSPEMSKPIKEIKYLMANAASIFNVTPPNKKDQKGKLNSDAAPQVSPSMLADHLEDDSESTDSGIVSLTQ